jgi:hypothetical protein
MPLIAKMKRGAYIVNTARPWQNGLCGTADRIDPA